MDHLNLRSDNCAPVLPEIAQALAADFVAVGVETGGRFYDDTLDDALSARFGELFSADVRALSVASGTAGNAVAIAALHEAGTSIYCETDAHIARWEAGATLGLSGAPAFVPVPGIGGKLTIEALERAIARRTGGVVSLTLPTETGVLYRIEEIRAIRDLTLRYGMSLHIDGARIANALFALGTSPADFIAATRVDALSFGGTKLGALGADAVLLFDAKPHRIDAALRLRKRMGQQIARRRVLNVQLLRLLDGDLWLDVARTQNAAAAALTGALFDTIKPVHPVETNQIFLPGSDRLAAALTGAGILHTRWIDGTIRLVLSRKLETAEIERVVAAVRSARMAR
jgi:threonine aldolase